MQADITFTAAAIEYIQMMVAKKNSAGFRLSIKKTGCSGYSYLPALVEQINSGDIELNLTPALTVYVDPLWLHLLQGVQVDYVEEGKAGLKQKRLVFNNPKESGRCGCGESFHLQDE